FDLELPDDGITYFSLSLATNVVVTILTAGRIWWISRKAGPYWKTDLQKRVASSIFILVESGVMYSAATSTYLALAVIGSPVQNPIFQMLTQLVGIVPTLIIARVGLGASAQSVESTVKSS
ncbi:hypothetical protein B0H17DRAFT_834120, partial [Mycena rosella]